MNKNSQNKMVRNITALRKRAETRAKNVLYMRAVARAKKRTFLKSQHDYYHSLLHSQISPQLRERVTKSKMQVTLAGMTA